MLQMQSFQLLINLNILSTRLVLLVLPNNNEPIKGDFLAINLWKFLFSKLAKISKLFPFIFTSLRLSPKMKCARKGSWALDYIVTLSWLLTLVYVIKQFHKFILRNPA